MKPRAALRGVPHTAGVATWLPLASGLTPHGRRHAHNTWMIEDGIPEVLRHARMGHQMDGIKAVCSHVTPDMRARLVDVLQRRWHDALQQRARIAPHSAIAALDTLLMKERHRCAS